jgi:hypothetical protein
VDTVTTPPFVRNFYIRQPHGLREDVQILLVLVLNNLDNFGAIIADSSLTEPIGGSASAKERAMPLSRWRLQV